MLPAESCQVRRRTTDKVRSTGVSSPTLGFLRKLTNSIISCLASSMPATSANLTVTISGVMSLAVERPTPKMPPAPPPPSCQPRLAASVHQTRHVSVRREGGLSARRQAPTRPHLARGAL